MSSELTIWDRVSASIQPHGSRVRGVGIRYGSVIYLGFGESTTKYPRARQPIMQFRAELEIGSDNWSIRKHGITVLQSDFSDPERARSELDDLLLDREFLDLRVGDDFAILEFSGDLKVEAQILADPASGFLFAFDVVDGPSWETVDGNLLNSSL